ncbi:MAG: hypothetical protein LQ344_007262 [Seirophora lacunosa]|nr:MAG: hypothetical protein LQ344_007262 [Seirophora lacunosa]
MSSILFVLSAFLALTTAQSLGDPAFLSSYPPCAAQCQVEVINSPSNPCAFTTTTNLTCQCAAANRAATAGCEKVSCSPAEYSTTQTLAEELCGPLYTNGSLSASPVTVAIASATAAADAAVAGKDPANPNDYPPCGTACQQQTLPGSGCGSLANTACVCGEGPLNDALGACEIDTCSREDLQTISYLAYRLCRAQGGVGNASVVANQTVATQTAGSVPMGPTMGTTPFTGGVAGMGAEMGGWVVLAMVAGAVGWVV